MPALQWIASSKQRGDGSGKQFLKRRLAVPFAPGSTYRQLLVQWLPAHAELRHQHIGVVVQEFFKAHAIVKFEGVNAGKGEVPAENRNPGFSVQRVGFSSPIDGIDRRIAGNIALYVQRIGSLFQRFAAELPTGCKTNAATRQLEERGGVDRGIQRPQFRDVFVFGMYPGKLNRSLIGGDRSAEIAK